MSETAVAEAPVTPVIDINAIVTELRQWALTECSLGDHVRDEAYRCAISAIVHRVLKWGHEPVLNLLTARDCMSCLLMAGGEAAEMFLRMAFTRGLIEDDRAVVQRILNSPFVPESRGFVSEIMKALTGDDEAMRRGAIWMETLQGEELSIACLLIGRQIPETIDPEWLAKCPESNPRLCAAMAMLLMREERFHPLVKSYVRARPHVRYAVNADQWGRL